MSNKRLFILVSTIALFVFIGIYANQQIKSCETIKKNDIKKEVIQKQEQSNEAIFVGCNGIF